ncbi:MAG: carbon-nitrogen hydrolase family protein [Gammaproteobacteria bacterium]|nr:carbon-nitrogen hydrolase family protein [Gammaproteobacteria bacterium]
MAAADVRAVQVAAIQHCATADVAGNLDLVERLALAARDAGAEAVMTAEAFAYIGPDRGRRDLLEPLPAGGPILDRCRQLAVRLGCDLVLGGFHEAAPEAGKAFNTCVHLDARGEVAALYRKIHLFDIELADGTELHESRRTAPGDALATTRLPFGLLGLTVCYDLRFPYVYQALTDQGAVAMTVPSAFTATTGAAHWHTLLRARAIECQCYVIAPAQHGRHNARRRSFGHSLIVDPWGEVIAECDGGDGFALACIDPARVAEVRKQLPCLGHRVAMRSLRQQPGDCCKASP